MAVIKVLAGAITVNVFNPLAETNNGAAPVPYASNTFHVSNVTYITPQLFQTHQLVNKGTETAITIQSYDYLHSDQVHYETFDFILPTEDWKHHFRPDSDFEFDILLQLARESAPKHAGGKGGLSSTHKGALIGSLIGLGFAVAVVVFFVMRSVC